MVIQDKGRISRALELLRDGLIPFVEREMHGRLGADWLKRVEAGRERGLPRGPEGNVAWDSQALLKLMIDNWQSVFKYPLRHLERAWVGELLDVRNRFAHEQPFSAEDTHRALDTAQRLLMAVSARDQAAEIDKIKTELMRAMYAVRTPEASPAVEGARPVSVKTSRETVTPIPKAPSGSNRGAEFKQASEQPVQPPSRELAKRFDDAMLRIYQRAKSEAHYNATIFFRMISERGGLATARYLINSATPSDGYTHLYERGRLDLTVEAVVVENANWHPLFTSEELAKARHRLEQYGYNPGTK